MGITKASLFTDQQNELAQLAKVLGHPARIAIIEHLVKVNACINNDLVNELGLAQATISQHLKELKAIGIIKGEVEGNAMNYCIDPSGWRLAKSHFNALFKEIDSCC